MAQQPPVPAEQQISPFPEPPWFFELYANGPESGPEPPQPVTGCTIAVFNEPFNPEEPYTEPLDARKLFQEQEDGSVKIKQELRTLNKGLLFMFMELLHTLVEQPSAWAAAVTPIKEALINMSYLINISRPIQARETLKYSLQLQISEKRTALADLRAKAGQIRQEVLAITQQLAAVGGDVAESAPREAAAAAVQQQDQHDQQQRHPHELLQQEQHAVPMDAES